MSRALWFGAVLALCPVVAVAQGTTALNPVYRRAQIMVNDGNVAEGRALIDSMIAVAPPGSDEYAEALYWRAVLAPTAADAEMDYRRIMVDYSKSPRVEDALIRLAQLELARGNYDGALRHLNRLATEHPDSPARARAGYWAARAMFDKNDAQGGCTALADAQARTTDADTELRNQISFLNQRCAAVAFAAPAVPQQTVPVSATPEPAAPVASRPADTEPVMVPPTREAPAPKPEPTKTAVADATVTTATGERVYSVQIAAYNDKSQADAMVTKLKKNGYAARVDGTSAPFRVRIGKYATQAQAGAVQRSLKAKQITGFVVQADIR
jgi:cell division septation protein DedD